MPSPTKKAPATERPMPATHRPPSMAAIWGAIEQAGAIQQMQVAQVHELVLDLMGDVSDLTAAVSELRDEITALRGR
jgi:hypothetical protein